jgi:hypothetical protein
MKQHDQGHKHALFGVLFCKLQLIHKVELQVPRNLAPYS